MSEEIGEHGFGGVGSALSLSETSCEEESA